MFLIKSKTNIKGDITFNDSCYVQHLRQAESVLTPDQISVGGYYVYKEKFGIVALVKVLEDISIQGWTGYRIMIKRVLYSPWQIPKNAVLEIGFGTEPISYQNSWHFEPGMMLVKCDKSVPNNVNLNVEIESAL